MPYGQFCEIDQRGPCFPIRGEWEVSETTRLHDEYVSNYPTNQLLDQFTAMPKRNNLIKDKQQESMPKRQFSEICASNYSSTASSNVSKMAIEPGQISNTYETISANPWNSHGECSKMRWLDRWGRLGRFPRQFQNSLSDLKKSEYLDLLGKTQWGPKPGGSIAIKSLSDRQNAGLDLASVELVSIWRIVSLIQLR